MKKELDTYTKLLNSALELFRKKGYSATGINEIVAQSGAPKGCLYHYFPGGKEEIAIKVVKAYEKAESNKIKRILSSSPDPVKAFELIFEEFIEKISRGGEFENLSITLLSLESINISESLRKACASAFESLETLFTERLVESGFKEEIAKERARILLCLFNGALTLSLSQKNISHLLLAKKEIRSILFYY
ncbi:TetR/AcrR family transcriptional regulator [Neomoorella mulderi]|uniref:Putative HTH-type transcriptional regulator YxaF n=1 Tax=Moorella mulderi DSM 14980 TaxID=1122241 RepID=A0A151AV07_9FIRM|nr:TetR/AcrR family transcriptional regulator [Moorella mulderi]KYH31485.1 putative HTH-type transcriptional regulator YxaF [Moorella mulderi DSM 14980]